MGLCLMLIVFLIACAANWFCLCHILICRAVDVYRCDNSCQAASGTEVCVSTNGGINSGKKKMDFFYSY